MQTDLHKWAKIALMVLAVFLGLEALSTISDLRAGTPTYNSISVNGEGEVFAVPDLATFSFSVSHDASTITEAQEQVTQKTDIILTKLKDLGIEEKDVKTTDYSAYPKYVYIPIVCAVAPCPPGRPEQDGYTVSHSVSVKVRDADKVGDAVAVVGSNGALNVSGVSFTTDDPDILVAKARELAIDDAKKKAKTLSKDLGVRLGKVISFYENPNGLTPYYDEAYGGDGVVARSASVPTLPVGENTIRVVVSVTYEIK